MARKSRTSTQIAGRPQDRVTLSLRLADGSRLEVEAGVHAMRFIGRLSRVPAFGPVGSRISAQLVARD